MTQSLSLEVSIFDTDSRNEQTGQVPLSRKHEYNVRARKHRHTVGYDQLTECIGSVRIAVFRSFGAAHDPEIYCN